jgi:MSHA biogenesis protein MshM
MYYRHFGLSGAPFQFTPSPKLLFKSKTHRETLAALESSLEQEPSGFSLLIGETGTGKTTLIASLLARSHAPLHIAYVTNPKIGFDDLLRDVARQFGIPAHADRLEFLDAFDRYLEELPPHWQAVVIIDEAQALSNETLDDLRLFANRDIRGEKRLHFVFAGQPGLLTRLCAPELRQLNERFDVRVLLNPLDAAEAKGYVDFRLAAFGGSTETLFALGALEHLLGQSRGIPRRINLLCHNAMRRAYRAGEPRVSLDSARDAASEVEELFTGTRHAALYAVPRFVQQQVRALCSTMPGLAPALVAATLAIAGIGSLYFWNSGAPRRDHLSIDEAIVAGNGVIKSPGANAAARMVFGREHSAAAAAMTPSTASLNGDQNSTPPRQVRVRPGDTLLTIARDYLGSDDDVDRLIRANPQVGNINHIYPGEMLNLPASGAGRPSASAAQQTVVTDSPPSIPQVSEVNYDGE